MTTAPTSNQLQPLCFCGDRAEWLDRLCQLHWEDYCAGRFWQAIQYKRKNLEGQTVNVEIVGMTASDGQMVRVLSVQEEQELLELGMEFQDCPTGQLIIEAVVESVPES